MYHRFHSLLRAIAMVCFLLSACAPKGSAPVPAETTTPDLAAMTPTIILPTSSATSWPVASTYEDALPLFSYDGSTPFDIKVTSQEVQAGATVQDLTYQAADPQFTSITGGRIAAYLVKPAGNGPFAGVLFLHGLGSGWGNRKEFLDEAVSLASQGVVSLLPTGLFPWVVSFTGNAEVDQMNVIKQVIELRRSVDFLLTQPGVDPQRIAFVGHDYGAMHGAVLAGVEKRIKAYVLMAGDSNYSDWDFQYFAKPDDEQAYRKLMSAVDPVAYLPHASPAAIFLQFGGLNGYVTQDAANQLAHAAVQPKKVSWYADAGHTLNAQARGDRLDWLTTELNLNPLP